MFSHKSQASSSSKYTVTYNLNGGEGSIAAGTEYSLIRYQISGTVPAKQGSEFLGWAKAADASSAEFAPGAFISLSANITLCAVWKTTVVVPPEPPVDPPKPPCSKDVNGDGKIDVNDLIFIRNIIFGKIEMTADINADINGDGKVDVLDLIEIRNAIFNKD